MRARAREGLCLTPAPGRRWHPSARRRRAPRVRAPLKATDSPCCARCARPPQTSRATAPPRPRSRRAAARRCRGRATPPTPSPSRRYGGAAARPRQRPARKGSGSSGGWGSSRRLEERRDLTATSGLLGMVCHPTNFLADWLCALAAHLLLVDDNSGTPNGCSTATVTTRARRLGMAGTTARGRSRAGRATRAARPRTWTTSPRWWRG